MTASRGIYRPHIIKYCEECGKKFDTLYCRRKKRFCCHKCSVENSKGKKHWWIPSTAFKPGHKHSKEVIEKLSKSKLGKPNYKLRGNNNPRWRGIKHKRYIHKCWTKKYKKWRLAVFKRDEYTCQECFKVGGYLQAHHINDWANHKNERYLVNNGVTLCNKCHKYVHRVERLNYKLLCQLRQNKKGTDSNTK